MLFQHGLLSILAPSAAAQMLDGRQLARREGLDQVIEGAIGS
jgi:hypothetical protein